MWIGSPLRGALRLVSYFLLTCLMVPVYLLATALRIRPIIRWMPLLYHRTVCFILGIRVHVHGKRSDVTPTLYVCNHISYLDIEVLGSRVPGSFVAKAEVATWPFFNVLARAQRTIFIERRSGKTSASRVSGGERRRVVILAEPCGCIAVIFEDASDRRLVLGNDAVVPGKASGLFGDHTVAHRMMIPSRNEGCASRRTERRGVNVIVSQATLCDPIQRGCRDNPTECARHTEPGIVRDDQ